MKLAFVVFATLCVSAVFAAPRWFELDGYSFEQYQKDFGGKAYDANELAMRRELFEIELDVVRQHNAGDSTWKAGINHMSDWTKEEKMKLNGHRASRASPDKVSAPTEVLQTTSTIPESLDWRTHVPSVVSPVKNQGQCGSCWTFATAETVESHFALKYPGKLQDLSEQQIASCPLGTNPNDCGGTGGCQGGTIEAAFESIIKAGGLASEWQYPYRSIFGTNYDCELDFVKNQTKISEVQLTSYVKNPSNQYWPLIDAVANQGPQAITVDASSWHNYETGVFDGCNQDSPVIDHGVQLVGYGDDEQYGPYWLIRNSWTPNFGENGYIRIRRIPVNSKSDLRCGQDTQPLEGTGCKNGPSVQTVCGTCGVLFDTSYPIIA